MYNLWLEIHKYIRCKASKRNYFFSYTVMLHTHTLHSILLPFCSLLHAFSKLLVCLIFQSVRQHAFIQQYLNTYQQQRQQNSNNNDKLQRQHIYCFSHHILSATHLYWSNVTVMVLNIRPLRTIVSALIFMPYDVVL